MVAIADFQPNAVTAFQYRFWLIIEGVHLELAFGFELRREPIDTGYCLAPFQRSQFDGVRHVAAPQYIDDLPVEHARRVVHKNQDSLTTDP
jgi:hypothetical protein